MAIKVMADSGGIITYNAAEIGAAFDTFACKTDYIIQGIAEEMSIGYASNSLTITVGRGKAVICGRPTSLPSAEQITLPANKTSGIFLVLRADLTKPVGTEGSIEWLDSESAIKSQNLNNFNGQHDLRLAKIKTSGSGVTEVTDQRVIRSSAIDVNAIMAQINAKLAEVDQKIAQLTGKVTGINTTNVLASHTFDSSHQTYTIPADGIMHIHYTWDANVYQLLIDGVYVGHLGANVETSTACIGPDVWLPVKAGTVVKTYIGQLTLFGTK